MIVFAHAGHIIVDLLYALPILVMVAFTCFGLWLLSSAL